MEDIKDTRKTRVFAAVTTAAVAASVCAFASEQENKKAEDAYLILDLEKRTSKSFRKLITGKHTAHILIWPLQTMTVIR